MYNNTLESDYACELNEYNNTIVYDKFFLGSVERRKNTKIKKNILFTLSALLNRLTGITNGFFKESILYLRLTVK